MLNKNKHFSCRNCNCKQKVEFSNKVLFCFGLVKNTYHKEDYYRFCIGRGKKRSVNEIMQEELYAMLLGLSNILFNKRLEEINNNATYKKKE